MISKTDSRRVTILALAVSLLVPIGWSATAPASAQTSSGEPTVVASEPTPDQVDVLGTAVGYVASEDFLTFMRNAAAGVREPGLFEGRGPLAIVLLVLIGGLALNLTPCVLPMIPINLAIIGAGTKAGSRLRGFLLGGTYGAAMALVYGVLGVVVVLTTGSFGALNASPWFNGGIALLFVVLALGMFDALTIDFSRFSSNLQVTASRRGSFALAGGMGAVAALLAGACIAPVVLQVVVLSSQMYAAGTTVALLLPFLLGVGMGAPWPFAGAGLAALPKPGPWMVHVKHAFGVVILATAAYYGYLAYGQVATASAAAAQQGPSDDGWYRSMPDAFAAAEAQNKAVLIDMWATWCKNCDVMDATTFQDPAVKDAMAQYVLVKLQAEDPEAQPAKGWMERFESIGLPTYAVVRARPVIQDR